MKPELFRHLTDSELILVALTTEAHLQAFKKEFELRNKLSGLNFKNFYLTRKEFNREP